MERHCIRWSQPWQKQLMIPLLLPVMRRLVLQRYRSGRPVSDAGFGEESVDKLQRRAVGLFRSSPVADAGIHTISGRGFCVTVDKPVGNVAASFLTASDTSQSPSSAAIY